MKINCKKRNTEYYPYLLEIEADTVDERMMIEKWHKQFLAHISKIKFTTGKNS